MRESEPGGHRQAQQHRSIGQRDPQISSPPGPLAHHHPDDRRHHHQKTRDCRCDKGLFDAIHRHHSPLSSRTSLRARGALRIRLCESACSFVGPRDRPGRAAEIATVSFYDFAVPGSAILRCCFANISFGVTLAIVVWSLFFIPVTMSDSPRSMASKPAFATS
jgi:hypothetical protein